MQSIRISSNSWHYKLLKKAGHRPHNIRDLCSYMRSLAATLILITFLCGILTAGVFFGFIILCYYVSIPSSWVVTLIASVIGVLWYLWYLGKLFSKDSDYIAQWRRWHHPDGSLKTYGERQNDWPYRDPYKSPSFWSAVWESFKDKVCFKLEVD
jgi:hypothetical protein